jgi:hypothetical protein
VKPRIKIVTSVPPRLGHCTHCEVIMRRFSFNDDQLKEMPFHIILESNNVLRILERINQINPKEIVQIIPTLSFEGMIYSAKYKIKKTPAIIIDNKKIFEGNIGERELSFLETLLSTGN